MSYAIATIIYGLPLVSNDFEDLNYSEELNEALENDDAGFHRFYSGGSNVDPAAFGVILGEFDEGCAYVDAHRLPLAPTPEQISEYVKLREPLSVALNEELDTYGEPRVFFLWSTS